MPVPKRSGVKTTLPSVRRIWLFSIPFVPGWLCLSSRLCDQCTRDARRHLLVVVEVAERPEQAELARRRQPLQRVGLRVHLVVDLRRAHAEDAQVGGEHHVVFQLLEEIALRPDAVGVRAAEELVGDHPVVDAEPVRELPLGAADRRQRRDAGANRDEAIERVAQIAGADDLRRIALRRVRRPDVEVVAELRRHEPTGERRKELRELNVLPLLNGVRDAEGIRIRRVDVPLIEITA